MGNQIYNQSDILIERYCVLIEDNALQISNISRIWYGPLLVPPLPKYKTVLSVMTGLIMGVFAAVLGGQKAGFEAFFLASPLAALITWGLLYKGHLEANEKYAVCFEMNSGSVYQITARDQDDIRYAYEEVVKVINSNRAGDKIFKISVGNNSKISGNFSVSMDNGNAISGDNVKYMEKDSTENQFNGSHQVINYANAEVLKELEYLLYFYRIEHNTKSADINQLETAIKEIRKTPHRPVKMVLKEFLNQFMIGLASELSLSAVLSALK